MSLHQRILNAFRKDALHREFDEEIADHLEEAVRAGRSRAEAERALGSVLRHREASLDNRVTAVVDSLRSDTIFAWRQLRRRPVVTAAAVLSLGLAIGGVTSAFRLIDALLLRPLPVADPGSLFVANYTLTDSGTGAVEEGESFSYPQFAEFREAAGERADLMVVSYASRVELTYGAGTELERAHRQWVSGNHFGVLGLQPAAGRLLGPNDDRTPGGHPVAVISYDYWQRRFAGEAGAVGRTVRLGTVLYEIIGVAPEGYTGTETGTVTDLFIPAMENEQAIRDKDFHWMRIWGRPRPGVRQDEIRQVLQASLAAHRRERTKGWAANTPQALINQYVNSELRLRPAGAGVSALQKRYRQPLLLLGAVVLLVLLIACANVANLLLAQAAGREKEMALRVSIGAGRWRLMQLMLLEGLLLAGAGTLAGGLFAWQAAPFAVGMIRPSYDPVRLDMPADWRVLGFAAAIALGVTLLFGLAPALRVSAVKPFEALKGGGDDPRPRRLMHGVIAAQIAFCFLVHYTAGLFVASFERLASQPAGFRTEQVLLLETQAGNGREESKRPRAVWEAILERVRATPGVESAALSGFPLMGGNRWSYQVEVAGKEQDGHGPYFLAVTPEWFSTMQIERIAGRTFRSEDRRPEAGEKSKPVVGAAIVNEAFARKYMDGQSPVGRSYTTPGRGNVPLRTVIVGLVKDAQYDDVRETVQPTVYVPITEAPLATITVHTSVSDPTALAEALRRLVPEVRSEFRVTNIRTQAELMRYQSIRERLLATLSLFFAVAALVLAGVGVYGVLHHAVVQRRREIGIRMALGARAAQVVRLVTGNVLTMMVLGSGVGLLAGLASERFLAALLYGVKGTDPGAIAVPLLTLYTAAILAALPAVLSATRTAPANALRSE